MTSATDKLRRLLDKRGVEWVASGTDTCWKSVDGYPMRAWDTTNGTHIRVADLTPEQAIAATLGRATCHKVVGKYGHRWSCSECGETLLPKYPSTRYPDGIVSYCPSCGAEVME